MAQGYTQTSSSVTNIKRQLADMSFTSNTSLTDLTDMVVTIGANENWLFEYVLPVTFGTIGQIKAALTGPSGCIATVMPQLLSNGIIPTILATVAMGATMALTAALATGGTIRIQAIVQNGPTEGNVILQVAQNTSSGTATVVKQNAYCIAHKL